MGQIVKRSPLSRSPCAAVKEKPTSITTRTTKTAISTHASARQAILETEIQQYCGRQERTRPEKHETAKTGLSPPNTGAAYILLQLAAFCVVRLPIPAYDPCLLSGCRQSRFCLRREGGPVFWEELGARSSIIPQLHLFCFCRPGAACSAFWGDSVGTAEPMMIFERRRESGIQP